MRLRRFGITISLILSIFAVYSQELRKEFKLNFRAGISDVDFNYADNARQISDLIAFINNVNADSSLEIVGVDFCGAVSPEGSYAYNRKLANDRLNTLEKMVCNATDISADIISRDDNYIPWDELRALVLRSGLRNKQEVLDIISLPPHIVPYGNGGNIDERVLMLRRLNNGAVWSEISGFFDNLRSASAIFTTVRQTTPAEGMLPAPVIPEIVDRATTPKEPTVSHRVDTIYVIQQIQSVQPEPAAQPHAVGIVPDHDANLSANALPDCEITPKGHVKTNVLGWAVLVANAAIEFDVARHFSVEIPIYYSAQNLFRYQLKFRILQVMPELRYWFTPDNDGFFLGAHVGASSYNFAFNGEFRYQDHNRRTPAWGGGGTVGYRFGIGRGWKLEFAVGVGAYRTHYDIIENIPDGLRVGEVKKTYLGFDKLAISFCYTFNLRKGGRK